MDFATTLGLTIGNAASGASAAAIPRDAKKRMNQKQFREMLLASMQQAGGEMRPLPSSRATGGTRKRGESELEFRFRMNQGLPKGARSGAGGGLDERLFMEEGMSQDEARRKALILRSQGGETYRDKEGKLQVRGKDTRKEVTSSTGRAYDPVAARKAFLANAQTAIKAKKQEQAADTSVAAQAERSARTPGTIRGMANQYGFGQAKTLTPEEFADRPEATVTLGRHKPFTLPLREEIDILKREQSRK